MERLSDVVDTTVEGDLNSIYTSPRLQEVSFEDVEFTRWLTTGCK